MDFTALAQGLWEQFLTVVNAPVPFLAALIASGFVTQRFWHNQYATRLANAQSTLELRDAQLQDYKDKLSGATPDEAKALIQELARRVDALGPRRLSAEQRQAIVATATPGNGRAVSIAADAGSADAQGFARLIAQAFTSSGWQVSLPMVMGVGNPPPSGIGVQVIDPTTLTAEEDIVVRALRAASLEFDISAARGAWPKTPGFSHFVVEIIITVRMPE